MLNFPHQTWLTFWGTVIQANHGTGAGSQHPSVTGKAIVDQGHVTVDVRLRKVSCSCLHLCPYILRHIPVSCHGSGKTSYSLASIATLRSVIR